MASAILFESRALILATIQHNWQCIPWLYIGSTKEFHVRGYANVSKQYGRVSVHSYMAAVSALFSNKVNDVTPISLTPIASKTLESIILNMVNDKIEENINSNQFSGMGGASTKDALVEMINMVRSD